ncbi:MAG: iron-sulfur cluster assembly protein [Kiritimatiellae bacterium]|jgi:metal-sulfur cluster biosynthetic enzyme|nr:iron-sulfur cluster assembly protein [Kiritimatiellia bacterium]
MSETALSEESVRDVLRNVIDPEIQYNILDMGLIYNVKVLEDKTVGIEMTLTSPACPFGPMIIHDVRESCLSVGAEDVQIELVWQPPWSPERMSEEAKLDLGFDL